MRRLPLRHSVTDCCVPTIGSSLGRRLSGATIFLDWAGAGEIREQNCYAAVVAIIWEPVPGRQYDDGTTPEAYGYVYSAKLFRGSRGQQLEAHVKAFYDVRALLARRASHPDFYLCCESFVDTTGDMRQNFEKEYNQLRTKYQFSQNVEYVPRIKHKYHRIEALQSPIENGWLCFSTKLPELYLDQMRTIPFRGFQRRTRRNGRRVRRSPWSLLAHNAAIN